MFESLRRLRNPRLIGTVFDILPSHFVVEAPGRTRGESTVLSRCCKLVTCMALGLGILTALLALCTAVGKATDVVHFTAQQLWYIRAMCVGANLAFGIESNNNGVEGIHNHPRPILCRLTPIPLQCQLIHVLPVRAFLGWLLLWVISMPYGHAKLHTQPMPLGHAERQDSMVDDRGACAATGMTR